MNAFIKIKVLSAWLDEILIPENGRATVKKVGCKVDHYRQLGQFLKNLSGIQKDFMKN